mmetsp:Transcript_78062/g.207154  ORF Transcript_78062/g.207154 Transcript_78062/m.207154 type:complete len:148 (-) Transcript_78062:105-548(-)
MAAGNVKLFNEAHSFLQNISGELEVFKQEVVQDHEQRKMEIMEARRKLEQEKFERREQINKLRYEFEDFVNRKVDKVLEDIEEMKMTEKRDDNSQQQQIEYILHDMELLREDLFAIQAGWGKLVSNCMVVPGGEAAASAAAPAGMPS